MNNKGETLLEQSQGNTNKLIEINAELLKIALALVNNNERI